jgi:hypothetical protein
VASPKIGVEKTNFPPDGVPVSKLDVLKKHIKDGIDESDRRRKKNSALRGNS